MWEHPDLLPSADDLDDASAYVSRSAPLDLSSLNDTPAPIPPDEGAPEHGGTSDPPTDATNEMPDDGESPASDPHGA